MFHKAKHTSDQFKILNVLLCWGRLVEKGMVMGNLAYQDRSLLIRVCTVDAFLLLSCSEYLHQVPVSPVNHWVEYQLIFKKDHQTFWPQNYWFSSLNTDYIECEILKLDNTKSNIQSLPDQNQREKCKVFLSPVNCRIKKGGKKQHMMHFCLGHIHRLQIHFQPSAYMIVYI